MEKLLISSIVYLILVISLGVFTIIKYKKEVKKINLKSEYKNRDLRINYIKSLDAFIYDFILLSGISAIVFLIYWFMI